MKRHAKRFILTNKTADIIVVLILFIAGVLSLNVLPSSLVLHILGIAFIIAGVYGLVMVLKGKRFFLF